MTTTADRRPTAPVGRPPASDGHSGRVVRQVLLWVILALLTIIFIAPLLWMLSTSLKTNADATKLPLSWWPRPFDTSAYQVLFQSSSQTPVLRWFANSLGAGVLNTALIVAVDAPAAYALARLDFRGKKPIFGTVIGTIFVPGFVFLVPNFLIVSQLGWLDSLWAIVVPSAGGAFGVFFLRQFFVTLPPELEESAVLDGANHWQIFSRIVLPNARPALATLAVLSFLTNWNDFLWPVYVLFSPSKLTLPAGLSTLQGAATTNYPIIMAGAVVASVPVLILFVMAQRQIVESVARSGIKG
ncbi:MAG: carbohydrate ABC transporter permease [Actinomycetota bacterium]|nr:carbohydrate ABC transporter permease [Actinomycetota bacterium]